MAEVPQEKPNISAEAPSRIKIFETRPDEILRHNISDEELSVLADSRRDYLWEGMWVALGFAFGMAPSSISTMKKWVIADVDSLINFTGGELFEIVAFFVSSAVFGLLCYIMKNKGKDARDLVQEIRDRTKREMSG